jgi:hypothetical protein
MYFNGDSRKGGHKVAGLSFSTEEVELWERVNELWRLTRDRKIDEIKSAFHPKYSGWVTPLPQPDITNCPSPKPHIH